MNTSFNQPLILALAAVDIMLAATGHGGPAVVAITYLEGTYTEFYSDISQDEAGLQSLFPQQRPSIQK